MYVGKGNKKGAVTVFLCMTLSAVLLLAGVFGEAAAGIASRSLGNAVFDLAGRSILSEYDRVLKARYGIFAFLMEEEVIENKMKEYVTASFTKSAGKTDLLDLAVEEVRVDCSEYVLMNPELLKQQILDYMGYRVSFDALQVLDALEFLGETGRTDEEPVPQDVNVMRTLRNGKVIKELPSRLLKGLDGGFKSILDLPAPAEMGKIAYKELCINLYILKCFRHDLDTPEWNNTFFSNEIEYILCGRMSDEANHRIVYLSLLAFRTLINAAHIRSDANKWEAVTLAATAAGGGVATVAAIAAIISAWAGAEAASDLSRLGKGEKVPLIKKEEDWVLGLDNVLEGNIDMDAVETDGREGLSYEEYLFLLLCFKDEESKLIRIMDLIQLNIKGMENKQFAIQKCCLGFRFYSSVLRRKGFPGALPFRRGEFSGIHVY